MSGLEKILEKGIRRIVKQELLELLNRQKKTDKIIEKLQERIASLESRLADTSPAPTKKNRRKPVKAAVNLEQLAARLEEYRRSNQLSVLAIAKQLGVAYTTYHDWEKGKRKPRIAQLQRIAELLGVTATVLQEESKAPKKQRRPRRTPSDVSPKNSKAPKKGRRPRSTPPNASPEK